jgi:hypothetical protein
MARSTERVDGRAGGRRDHSESIRDKSLEAPIPPPYAASEALPGELGRLQREPGDDGPITEDEILGSLRRRTRYELAERAGLDPATLLESGLPPELEAQVPAALPDWDQSMERNTIRMTPRLKAALAAVAEYHGVTTSAELELVIYGLTTGPLVDPEEHKDRRHRYRRETTELDRARARLDSRYPVREPA